MRSAVQARFAMLVLCIQFERLDVGPATEIQKHVGLNRAIGATGTGSAAVCPRVVHACCLAVVACRMGVSAGIPLFLGDYGKGVDSQQECDQAGGPPEHDGPQLLLLPLFAGTVVTHGALELLDVRLGKLRAVDLDRQFVEPRC